MDTWRLVDLGVFLTFFSTPSCLASFFSFLGHTHKAEVTNLQNTELLCIEFVGLVELWSDTVLVVNLHHFLGIYAIFLWNLRRFGGNLHPFTQYGGRGLKSL